MRITIENLTCGYGDKDIVRNFSVSFDAGEIVALLGPNGIGKTTLFKSILRLVPIRSGRIRLDGTDAGSLSDREFAKRIAYVPQTHTPPFSFWAIEEVTMGRTAHMGASASPKASDTAIAQQSLERLGIADLAERQYTELSGGERQLVLVARALAQEPAVLLMDEPTSNLDFDNQARVLSVIKHLAEEGLGILLTTHAPDQVFLCDAKVCLMKRGFRYEIGNASEILTQEQLKDAYGIEVTVLHQTIQGIPMSFCQPKLVDYTVL